jgi:hypothetical protein
LTISARELPGEAPVVRGARLELGQDGPFLGGEFYFVPSGHVAS